MPGEAGAAPALARELRRLRNEPVATLITTVGAGTLVPSVADQSIHQLVPGETLGSVTRFLDHWRPDVGVMLGVPDRPNLVVTASERGIPLFLAASHRGSLASRRRLSLISSDLLDCFDACLAASAADAEVLYRHLENRSVAEVTGPLGDIGFPPPCSETERDVTARALKGRPVWLAVDAVAAETEMVETAHRRASRFAHRLLLVVIPRDAESAAAMAEYFENAGWKVARSSQGGDLETDQVLIADSEEEHGLWFRLAPITFVGGTMAPDQMPSDPFPPAMLGSAVVHGPYEGAVEPRFRALAAAKATAAVTDAESLGEAVQRLLSPDKAAELAQAGWQVTTEAAHVVERLAELICTSLDDRRRT